MHPYLDAVRAAANELLNADEEFAGQSGILLPVRSGPGLPAGSGTAGTPNLPARRFSVEQTSTLDPNYCYTVKELAFL